MVPPKSARSRLHDAFESSSAARFLRGSKSLWSDAWNRGRALNKEEIRNLENRGNVCEDWKNVRLSGPGALDAVHHCRFEGRVLLRTENGSPRLWRSRLRDVTIGAAEMEDVGFAERLWIEDGSAIRGVHEIMGLKNSRFCLGLPIHPGSETKTRRIFLCDGLRVSDCHEMAALVPAEQKKLERELASRLDALESDYAFVGKDARIERISSVEDCYIGPGTVIRAPRRCGIASWLPRWKIQSISARMFCFATRCWNPAHAWTRPRR